MLKLSGVKKQYGSRVVLTVPEFSFDHSIHWIKGGNGSGKTTLLKILAGIVPFEGTVSFNDIIDLRKHAVPYRKVVNYAEAEPLYPSFLTGTDLVRLYESSKKGDSAKVRDLITRFGIDGFIDQPVGTYSSGMVKKLSLMLAFIGHPEIILLDEPLVTLENRAIPILTDLINEYYSKGVTFIFTSHQIVDQSKFLKLVEAEVRDQTLWQ